MREKVDFGRATGLDCGNVDIKEMGIDREKFIVWLLTNHQPMGTCSVLLPVNLSTSSRTLPSICFPFPFTSSLLIIWDNARY